jgi:hypothetical protein
LLEEAEERTVQREAEHKAELEKARQEARSRDTVLLEVGQRVACHVAATGEKLLTGFVVSASEETIELQCGSKKVPLFRENVYFTETEPLPKHNPIADMEADLARTRYTPGTTACRAEAEVFPKIGQRVTFHVNDSEIAVTGEVFGVDYAVGTVTLDTGGTLILLPREKGYFVEAAPLSREETPEYAKEAARKHIGEKGKVYYAAYGRVYEGPIVEITPTYALQLTDADTITLHRLKDLDGEVAEGENIIIENGQLFGAEPQPLDLHAISRLIQTREVRKYHLDAMWQEVIDNCPDSDSRLRQLARRLMYGLRDKSDETLVDRQTTEKMLEIVLGSRDPHRQRDDLGR